MVKVSVIIPSYKGSKYVRRAVDSVLNQTYKDVEIIVVDDNGLGNEEQIKTEEVLCDYIASNRIKYVPHTVNKNGSAARNTGASNSTGEYICLLDDDDMYYPDKVEKQVAELEQLPAEWGMVYCAFEGPRKGKSGKIAYELLIHSVVIGSNSFMIRREIWEQVGGFDESFRRHQDYEFTARVANVTKIKYMRFVGFDSEDTYRNNPKNLKQQQEQRAHYLTKMLPIISTFPIYKQKMIICYNAMEVTSKGSLKKTKDLLHYAAQWEPHFGYPTVFIVTMLKAFRKLKWRLVRATRKEYEYYKLD